MKLSEEDRSAIYEWSRHAERATNYDSIDTVERVYGRTDRGAFCCCWPDCEVRKLDAVALWRHVHFSVKHGPSFGIQFGLALEYARELVGRSA